MPILSTSETTEVIYGRENIVGKIVKQISEVKDCTDGCGWLPLTMVVSSEPVRKALIEAAKSGIRIRTITNITKDNISYCKILVEDGHQLRHLDTILVVYCTKSSTGGGINFLCRGCEWLQRENNDID